ncbi:DUF935 family protein [Bacteroides sp. OF04-15BH]|nr:DUF935 family protein [Bacteroides sp. OF04-15BH]
MRPAQQRRLRDMSIKLQLYTEALTRRDLADWRRAWQMAINVDCPNRTRLLHLYTDVEVDLHLTGCVQQRMGFVLNKSFKLCDAQGAENRQITELFESPWFKELMRLVLESTYYGHSLIELGDVIEVNGRPAYKDVKLVPRTHVIPEFGVITTYENETWQTGYDYRNSEMADWCIEAGGTHDLGLYLKCAQQTIPKKNMCSFWDMFGEVFGMPLRVATTTSRDPKEFDRIENMLRGMGAASYGLFPEGTTVDLKESSRADAFNVYDKRIDRCNSEISKGILTVTMTMEDGASLSQSEVHRKMLENLIQKDSDMVRDLVNWQLIPRMVRHGFPVAGYHFEWDESVDYTPEQQVAYERLILEHYEVDTQYFIDKYNVPLIRRKSDRQAVSPVPAPKPEKKEGKASQRLARPEESGFFD